MFDPEEEALKKILGDVDGMEGHELSAPSGAAITIEIVPHGGPDGDEDQFGGLPPDHDISLCKGECAYHQGGMASHKDLPADASVEKMAAGGIVGEHPIERPEDTGLGFTPADRSGAEAVLPQLRRKKKTLLKP